MMQTLEELVGKKPPYPWWVGDTDAKIKDLKSTVLTGVRTIERCNVKRNGEFVWVQVSGRPVYVNRELKYYLSNWVDISERKKTVRLVDGSYHEVESSEMAFKIAGSLAWKEAAGRARPQLLGPVMNLEVVMPEEFMGDVIGDLNARRGRIEGFEERCAYKAVRAMVPLAQMFGYATAIRSQTQGRATFSMQFARYEAVPDNVAETVLEKVLSVAGC